MIKINNFLIFLFFVSIQCNTLKSDNITVNNETVDDLYVAVYYQKNILKKEPAKLEVGPLMIKGGESTTVERPSRKIGYDRQLAFDGSIENLKPEIPVIDFTRLAQTNIGNMQGNTVYILEQNYALKGYNTAEWTIKKPFLKNLNYMQAEIEKVTRPVKDTIKKEFKAIRENPYKDTVGKLRIGNDLHPDERAYLEKRMPKVKTALEKFLGHEINQTQIPKIALVESGGGYRAMTCSVGWHVGAAKIGLMDAVTYMVGLSGSTWSIGLWVTSGQPIETFKKNLIPKMKAGLIKPSPAELELIVKNFLVKALFDQEVTFMDLYGGLLANDLLNDFGDDRQRIYLSNQAANIKEGQLPFPIYTTVSGDVQQAKQNWYEYTPYEVGATWLGMYTPTWAYGRKFEKGQSIDFAPEQSLGFQLGSFGSAFAASFSRIYKEIDFPDQKPPMNIILEKITDTFGEEPFILYGTKRATAITVNNFSYGMPQSTIKQLKKIMVVDAGLEFNLPYPPISGERPERKADIIIILDASGNKNMKDEFSKVELYARNNKLKYPSIDYTNIQKQTISIFKDENDPSVPLVIYLPRINDTKLLTSMKNNPNFVASYPEFIASLPTLKLDDFDVGTCIKKDYCTTGNFSYSEQEVDQLSAVTEFNILANKDVIRDAIEWKVNQMNGKKS